MANFEAVVLLRVVVPLEESDGDSSSVVAAEDNLRVASKNRDRESILSARLVHADREKEYLESRINLARVAENLKLTTNIGEVIGFSVEEVREV